MSDNELLIKYIQAEPIVFYFDSSILFQKKFYTSWSATNLKIAKEYNSNYEYINSTLKKLNI